MPVKAGTRGSAEAACCVARADSFELVPWHESYSLRLDVRISPSKGFHSTFALRSFSYRLRPASVHGGGVPHDLLQGLVTG